MKAARQIQPQRRLDGFCTQQKVTQGAVNSFFAVKSEAASAPPTIQNQTKQVGVLSADDSKSPGQIEGSTTQLSAGLELDDRQGQGPVEHGTLPLCMVDTGTASKDGVHEDRKHSNTSNGTFEANVIQPTVARKETDVHKSTHSKSATVPQRLQKGRGRPTVKGSQHSGQLEMAEPVKADPDIQSNGAGEGKEDGFEGTSAGNDIPAGLVTASRCSAVLTDVVDAAPATEGNTNTISKHSTEQADFGSPVPMGAASRSTAGKGKRKVAAETSSEAPPKKRQYIRKLKN